MNKIIKMNGNIFKIKCCKWFVRTQTTALVIVGIFSSLYTQAQYDPYMRNQKKEIIVKTTINDTLICNASLFMNREMEDVSLSFNSNYAIRTTFWPNNSIGMILVRKNDSSAIKLGFNEGGKLDSHEELKILKDTMIRDGQSFFYDDEGYLVNVYTYKNGVMNGSYRTYYKNGLIKCSGEYLNDEEVGIWSYYSPKGVLIKKVKK